MQPSGNKYHDELTDVTGLFFQQLSAIEKRSFISSDQQHIKLKSLPKQSGDSPDVKPCSVMTQIIKRMKMTNILHKNVFQNQ